MGTSSSPVRKSSFVKDHPHAYGDKYLPLHCGPMMTGSSPRVWGQAPLMRCTGMLSRIIPTRMGTRKENSMIISEVQDHPHAYGDKFRVKLLDFCKVGSSPRVWGQVTEPPPERAVVRIIPTRMGTRISLGDICG